MPHERGRDVRRSGRAGAKDIAGGHGSRARELLQQGVEQLQRQRIASAQRLFRQALGLCESFHDARAYLSLTHGMLQQWERAAAEARVVLQSEPDHLIGLAASARAHGGAGRLGEAAQYAVRALRRFYRADADGPDSPEQLRIVAEMLVFLEADGRLSQLYRRRVRGRGRPLDSLLLAWFGIASFNSGRYRDARWAWHGARRADCDQVGLYDAYSFVNDMVEQERVPPFRLDYGLQPDDEVGGGPDGPGFLKVFALHTLWKGDDPAAKQAALELLVRGDDDWVTAFLLNVVRDPDLDDETKLHAGTMLTDLGLVPEDDPLEMHLDGELKPVTFPTERMDFELDPETAAFFGEAVEADSRGQGAAAESGYRAVLRVAPHFVPALLGLAAIYQSDGRLEEAEKLLTDGLEAAPNRQLIRFHLAALHMQQEKFAQAWSRLWSVIPAELPRRLRPVYYWLYGRLALLLDSPERAEAAFQQGLQEDPRNEDLYAGLASARRVAAENRKRIARSAARRRRRQEEQPIVRDLTWAEALHRLTVPRLQAMARRIGVTGLWSLRKEQLVAAVAEVLREELVSIWHALAPKEQSALRWLDARGGWVAYDELRRRFGDDADDSIDWLEMEPETVPMRLQFHGFVFIGRPEDGSEPVALVPLEARQALKFAGLRTP